MKSLKEFLGEEQQGREITSIMPHSSKNQAISVIQIIKSSGNVKPFMLNYFNGSIRINTSFGKTVKMYTGDEASLVKTLNKAGYRYTR